jgi:hypothetical protein
MSGSTMDARHVTRAPLAVALGLVAAGCTPYTGEPTPAAQPAPVSVPDQRYALEGAVQYVDRWSHQYLTTDLAAAHRTGPIPTEAWQRALRRAADGAVGVHLGCGAAEVTVGKAGAVNISLTDCTYPDAGGASAGVRTLAAAQGCLIPASPAGSAEEFVRRQLTGGSPPPAFVDSATKAGPGTWHVGACA